MHGKAITQSKAPACAECHTSHSIKRIKELKAGISESQYCLTCHRHSLNMPLKSGESLTLFVDEKVIMKSVHEKLPCSNCHAGFSKDEHPVKVFKNRREFSTAAGSICKKCHSEADKQYESGIHFTALKEGNLKAPSCTDCHGFHSTVKATTDKTFGLLSCTKCHGEENKAYEKSIHNTARIKGKENAPICSSCHKSHDVKVTAMTMKMKEVCLTCHKDGENVHKKWLSNPPFKLSSFAGLHLDTVACAVCHSPGTKGGVYLCLYDRKTGKPISEEEVSRLLGTDAAGLKKELDPLGKGVGSSEVWNIIRKLNDKGADVTFLGRLDVRKGTEAHLLAEKKKAVRDCEYCHRADTDFYKSVSIVLFKSDGRPTLHTAKQEVLGSIFTILPASQFYVLGGTRIGLLDIIGIIAVLGGIAFPIGHIAIRIITSPIRTLRKMGKGGGK
jgi:predicted CXXCH cytochrome family protein